MSENTIYARQYQKTLNLLTQQKGTKLRGTVQVDTDFEGEYKFYNQIGSSSTVEKTTRHQTTPILDPDLQRTRISRREYLHNFVLDENDRIGMALNPMSSYMTTAVYAHGRTMDDRIIEAAYGTRYSGAQGGTSTALGGTQTIASGSVGMTKDKLIEARKKFLANDVDLDNEDLFLLIGEEQWEDLQDLTEVVSSDYNTEKTLASGKINTYLGFNIIITTRLDTTGSDRICLAYVRSGMQLAIAKDFRAEVDRRKDLNYSWQVWSNQHIGATRMEEKKVVRIDCTE